MFKLWPSLGIHESRSGGFIDIEFGNISDEVDGRVLGIQRPTFAVDEPYSNQTARQSIAHPWSIVINDSEEQKPIPNSITI